MTRCLDGPAAGQTLQLRRAPTYLRVVVDAAGTWDALDQLDDYPQMDETVYAYRMEGEPTWMHVRARTGGGFYRGGQYRVVEPQPDQAVLRSETRWQAWVSERVGRPMNPDGTAADAGLVGQ